jgi:hypothetical protein
MRKTDGHGNIKFSNCGRMKGENNGKIRELRESVLTSTNGTFEKVFTFVSCA